MKIKSVTGCRRKCCSQHALLRNSMTSAVKSFLNIVCGAALLIPILCTILSCDPPANALEINEVCRLSFDPESSERIVVDALRSARRTVDIALYGFENEAIAEEVICAARRGVAVRCVTEYDSEGSDSWQRIIGESRDNSSISLDVLPGNTSGIMHNKYFIIDDRFVITGSTNLTQGMFIHFNNMIMIDSPGLANSFKMDFEVLHSGFNASSKGNDISLSAEKNGFNLVHGDGKLFPETQFSIRDMRVRAYFTPYKAVFASYKKSDPVKYIYFDYEKNSFTAAEYDNAMNVIFPLLEGARESITVYSFALTDKVVMDLLVKAHARGAAVRVWTDYSQFVSSMCHSGRSIVALAQKTGGLYLCRRPDGGLLHHKVIVIDGKCVVLGSLNFSSNAVSDNDENFLVFENAPVLAAAFIEEGENINKFSHRITLTEEQADTLASGCGAAQSDDKEEQTL